MNDYVEKGGREDALRIILVGSGRLAHALARTMPERIIALYGRDLQRLQAMKSLLNHSTLLSSVDEFQGIDCDAIWIATADRDIEMISGEIAGVRDTWQGVVVVHSSGAVPLAALEVVHQRGGGILALHPNVSLTGDEPIPEGLLWSVASDGIPDDFPQLLLEGLHPRLVAIVEELRPLYHAAASAAANYSVTLFAMAEELYRRAGVSDEDARSTVTRFMMESIERTSLRGAHDSITGPIVRGDRAVVREQLRLVKRNAPELFTAFRSLAETTALLFADPDMLADFVEEHPEQNHSDRGMP